MPESAPTDASHRHRWSGADFYLDNERPMLCQACAGGAERRLRAFERYWDPMRTRAARAPRDEP